MYSAVLLHGLLLPPVLERSQAQLQRIEEQRKPSCDKPTEETENISLIVFLSLGNPTVVLSLCKCVQMARFSMFLSLNVAMLEKIWKPDTYFHNGLDSYLHSITRPNKLLRISENGDITYSIRSGRSQRTV